MVVVALGEPGTPVVSTVPAGTSVAEMLQTAIPTTASNRYRLMHGLILKNLEYIAFPLYISWVEINLVFILGDILLP